MPRVSSIPDFVKTWWPVVTVVLFFTGMFSTALTYYAKAETRELIKVELVEPLDKIGEKFKQQDKQLDVLELQNSEQKAKIDLMIQMMIKQNQNLDYQTKTLEDIQEKVK